MSLFAPRGPADIAALIGEHPLAWVVSCAPGFLATPLPLIAELGEDGSVVALVGHFALRNPHVAALRAAPHALILFQGAQGYISPGLVTQPQWAPTWNYAVVRFQVEIVFAPQDNAEALDRLIAHVEEDSPNRWTTSAMGERYEPMLQQIVAFRASVLSCDATFKLGQDERPATFAQILGGHSDEALVEAMERARV
jgi:transcriptional regulator